MATFVTISPPTPNGDLHLGHLSGPFLSADVYTRLQRARGKEAYLISYSDDLQSYVARRARQNNVSNEEVFRRNRESIRKSLGLADIHVDHFMAAGDSAVFKEEVARYYDALHNVGAIAEEETQVPYCETCKVYGYEAFGRTKCDVCGASTDLSQCESCATQPVYSGQEVSCVLCGGLMAPVTVKREYVDVSKYHDLIASSLSRQSYRSKLSAFLSNELRREGRKWYIDRPYDSGIEACAKNGRKNTLHTWFAGLPGYMASIRELFTRRGEEGRRFNAGDDRLVSFFGFDCSYSHAVIYPLLALLSGEDPSHNEYYTNAFLKLEGRDFSTSRNEAIWVNDVLPKYDSDHVRLFLCLNSPEDQCENFVMNEFVAWDEEIRRHNTAFLGELSRVVGCGEVLGRLLEAAAADVRRRISMLMEPNRFSAKGLATMAEGYRKMAQAHHGKGPEYLAFNLIYAYVATPVMPKFSSAVFNRQAELKKKIDTVINA